MTPPLLWTDALARGLDAFAVAAVAAATFGALLAATIAIFSGARPRRGRTAVARTGSGWTRPLEVAASTLPLLIALGIFFWGAAHYVESAKVPVDALSVSVVARPPSWEFRRSGHGPAETGELHVPVGRPIKLLMTSEEGRHGFFVPAFRMKRDVFPGRYGVAWLEAVRPGEFPLRCADAACAGDPATMAGRIVALSPPDYLRWLGERNETGGTASPGESLFRKLDCGSCHGPESTERGPSLGGVFGATRRMQDGSVLVADEAYLRESILKPGARRLASYGSPMPAYAGRLSEGEILELIDYFRSLPAPP